MPVKTGTNNKEMKATILQAENNERDLSIQFTGYGHWYIECNYRGSRIGYTTTDSEAIDDYRSEYGEKRDGRNCRLQGYVALCEEIIRRNK